MNGALLAQELLALMMGVVGAFILGKGGQGGHDLPHFVGLHPWWRGGCVQALAIGKELEPALLFRDDLRDVEFTQLQ